MAGLYEEKILGAEQSRELARKLRESGEAIPQGQMVSGWYVPPSIAQSLAGALKQGIGAYKENQAEDELKGLKQERARSSADAFSQMGMQAPSGLLAEAGTPAVKPSIMDRIGAALTFNAQPKGTPAQPYQQTIAQNPNETQTMGGILNLAGSNPEMAAVAQAMQGQKWTRENAAALAKQALIEKNAAREDTQAFQAQQNELARLQAKALHDDTLANRPQPQAREDNLISVLNPQTGLPELKRESQSEGLAPGGTYKAPAALKAIPAGPLKAYTGNNASMQAIDRAAKLSADNPNSTGLKFGINNQANQHFDPEGVPTRAAISDIGSQKIHDRSGASVTVSESPRLAPFIPTERDSAEVIQSKLKNLALNINDMQNSIFEAHPPEIYTQQQLVQHMPKILGGEDTWSVKEKGR
jgi:hypothetical protein